MEGRGDVGMGQLPHPAEVSGTVEHTVMGQLQLPPHWICSDRNITFTSEPFNSTLELKICLIIGCTGEYRYLNAMYTGMNHKQKKKKWAIN